MSLPLIALLLTTSGCSTLLPPAPVTSLCSFDNASTDDGSIADPNFKCKGQAQKRFKVDYRSPDANGMMCLPYKDWIAENAYLKKVVYILQQNLENQLQSK